MIRSRLHQRLLDKFVQDSRRFLEQGPKPKTWHDTIDEILRLTNKTAQPAQDQDNNYTTRH